MDIDMDKYTMELSEVLASITKISVELMLRCKNDTELSTLRRFAHEDIDCLCNLLKHENKGVEYESDK